MTEYTKHLSEPWFSLIQLGLKKCEGRLNKGDFAEIKKGDFIIFQNADFGFPRTFKVRCTSIKKYATFKDYLEKEKLEKCLPGIANIDDGVAVYRKYFKQEDEVS